MEEHWSMRTEIPTPKLSNYPARRSTEYTTISDIRKTISDDLLSPENFTDVFGGPPLTILSRQFPATSFFYEDRRRGRNLPQFSIPSGKQSSSDDLYQQNHRHNGFLSHIFGWEAERLVKSRSRTKTSSSSALSSEELSPLRPAISDYGYDDVSLFASKLRPINVRARWDSTRIGQEDHQKQKKWPPFGRANELPKINNLEQISNRSFRATPDDIQFNSPASAVSSLSLSDRDIENCDIEDEIMRQNYMELEEDESMCSYVIDINSGNRETPHESNGVDEAIAWAKEKFQSHSSKEKPAQELPHEHQLSEGNADCTPSVDEQQDKRSAERETSKIQEEMHLLDEKIRLWSTGKEGNIRLLLSSLHHILWPNSGWLAMSLTNLIEESQVKKAYQKAVLCLHSDKLQQKGATLPQKYIAEKAFSSLQDAWAQFISLDVFCH